MTSLDSRAIPSGGVRFAPSPTGRFHIGNLRTAVVSKVIADQLQLPWIVRFEDIDSPRVVPGAKGEQLADLRALDLIPDLVLVQSEFRGRHLALFERAVASGQVYPCDCSRKEIQVQLSVLASAPHQAAPTDYTGHCRDLPRARELRAQHSLAWRMRMPRATGHDDFIVARTLSDVATSFQPSYQWACAIDDLDGRYDLLVRAVDLRPSIPQQRAVQAWLMSCGESSAVEVPAVFHTSLVTLDGLRLEKRSRGVTLRELVVAGHSQKEILRVLQRSFAPTALGAFAPGDVAGELAETIEFSCLFE